MPRLQVRFETPIRGLRLDIAPTDMPADSLFQASNVVFRRGRFQPRYGVSSLGTAVGDKVVGVACVGKTQKVAPHVFAATDVVVAGTVAGWKYYTSGPGWTALTGSISSSSHIVFRTFNKSGTAYVVGLNDGIDVPKRWDLALGGAITSVGGSPAKAKCMMVLANRMLMFNLATSAGYTGVVSPVGFDVSAYNDFESGWSSTLNGLLIDTPGAIVAAQEMGDLQGAIYKSDAVIMAIAQGGINPFHFEWRSIGNIGPCNQRCVVTIADGSHVFLGSDGGVHRFDGVSVRALDAGSRHIQKAILRMADPDLNNFTAKAHGFYNADLNEVTFFFKGNSAYSGGGTTEGVVINMDTLAVWPVTYSLNSGEDITEAAVVNIDGDTRARTLMFVGTTGRTYVEANNTMQDNGSNFTASWQYGYSDFGAPGVFKTITESDHIFQSNVFDANYTTAAGNQDVLGSLGFMDDSGNESTTSSQTMSLTTSAGAQHILDHRTTALAAGPRYIVSTAKLFDFRGATLRAVTRGER